MLLRYGELCGKCGDECRDTPSAINVLEVDVPGRDTKMRLDRCPREILHGRTDLFTAIAIVETGHLPVAGGMLDQTHLFIEAAAQIKADLNSCDET